MRAGPAGPTRFEWWRKYLRANGAWPGSCESDGCRRRGWDVICRGQRVAGHIRSSWWGGERGSRSRVAGVHRRDLSWLETNKFAPCVQSSPMWRDEIELLWLTWTQPSSSFSDCSTSVFGSPTRPVVRTSENSDPLPALSSPAVPLHTLLVPHLQRTCIPPSTLPTPGDATTSYPPWKRLPPAAGGGFTEGLHARKAVGGRVPARAGVKARLLLWQGLPTAAMQWGRSPPTQSCSLTMNNPHASHGRNRGWPGALLAAAAAAVACRRPVGGLQGRLRLPGRGRPGLSGGARSVNDDWRPLRRVRHVLRPLWPPPLSSLPRRQPRHTPD